MGFIKNSCQFAFSLALAAVLAACQPSTGSTGVTPKVETTIPAMTATILTVASATTTTASPATAVPTKTRLAIPSETPTSTLSEEDNTTYRDEQLGFEFDYPAGWSSMEVQAGGGGRADYIKAFASWPLDLSDPLIPDGETRMDLSVTRWEPLDLDQYIATRLTAWEASGISILSEKELDLAGGLKAAAFQVEGPDGSQAFFQFALIGERFVTLSGSGDMELLSQVGNSLRLVQSS